MFSEIKVLSGCEPRSYHNVLNSIVIRARESCGSADDAKTLLDKMAILLNLASIDMSRLEQSIDSGLAPIISSIAGTLEPKSFDAIIDGTFNTALEYVDSLGGGDIQGKNRLAAHISSADARKLCGLYFLPSYFREFPKFAGYYAGLPPYSTQQTHWKRPESDYPKPPNKTISEIVNDKLKISTHISILDVGLGDGYFMKALKDTYGDRVKITGVGLENEKIAELDNQIIGPIELVNIPANYYDLIVSNFALGYTLWPNVAYRKILLGLKPSGIAVLEIPLVAYSSGSALDYEISDYMLRNSETGLVQSSWNYEAAQHKWKNGSYEIEFDNLDNVRTERVAAFSDFAKKLRSSLNGVEYSVSMGEGGSSGYAVPVVISRLP